jgi:hypothetical protein
MENGEQRRENRKGLRLRRPLIFPGYVLFTATLILQGFTHKGPEVLDLLLMMK